MFIFETVYGDHLDKFPHLTPTWCDGCDRIVCAEAMTWPLPSLYRCHQCAAWVNDNPPPGTIGGGCLSADCQEPLMSVQDSPSTHSW